MKNLSRRYLKECFVYQPLTGKLIWLRRPRKHYASDKGWKIANKFAGKEAGSIHPRTGHLYVGIDGVLYAVHRVIWKMQTGRWPKRGLDHEDLDSSNNRWKNLRQATQAQNQLNTLARAEHGFKGATYRKDHKHWHARISFKGCRLHLGAFKTAAEATSAYAAKAKELYGEFARVA